MKEQLLWTGKRQIFFPSSKRETEGNVAKYRAITLLSLPPKVYARLLERNDTQCRFGPQQLTNLFTLRQDSDTLDLRLPREASSKIIEPLAAIHSFYNDCKSNHTRWSSAGISVLSTRLHYFDGEDLPEKHYTRLYDDKSRVSALFGRHRQLLNSNVL